MTLFFGLDGEMSAADLPEGGRLIQIGIAAHTLTDGTTLTAGSEAFSMMMNPGEMYWEPVAAGVHGIPREAIEQAAPAAEVDEALYQWLIEHGARANRRENTVAVGFNVGSFDLPHLAAVLPRSHSLFNRRSLDLNAVCFTLDGATLAGVSASAETWKTAAKDYAVATLERLGYVENQHDAGYDALLHLHVWRFLKAACAGQPITVG